MTTRRGLFGLLAGAAVTPMLPRAPGPLFTWERGLTIKAPALLWYENMPIRIVDRLPDSARVI